jgi:hypothetical protein
MDSLKLRAGYSTSPKKLKLNIKEKQLNFKKEF